jgi:tetratricopeptide (TPR) repeat protein
VRGICVAALLLAGALGRADEDPTSLSAEERKQKSRVLFERGRAHFNLGDYPSAIKDFEQAYLLKPLPLFLYNIAQLAALLDQRERALRLYEQFVREDPNAPERPDAERRIVELQKSLADRPEVAPKPEPAPPRATPPPVAPPVVVSAPPPERKPRSRAWIWGVVGASVVVVTASVIVGVALGVPTDPTPSLGRGTLQ